MIKKTILVLSALTLLNGCAGTQTANQIAGKIPWPTISSEYQTLLMKAGNETAKKAIEHELDWQGWANKMENRVGY